MAKWELAEMDSPTELAKEREMRRKLEATTDN